MLRSALSKVAWVGRTASMVFGLALVLALMFGVASAAFGANGQAWILGKANVATAITSLGGKQGVNGPMVRIANNNAGANDTALALNVQAGEPPLRVNRATRVPNLNADKLDGKDSTGFYAAGSKVADSDKLDGLDSAAFWRGPTYFRSKSVSGTANSPTYATHTCDTEDKLLSGGYYMSGTGFEVYGDIPYYSSYHLYWRSDGTADDATLYVHCADF